jgi:hypothetical protein
MRGRGFWAVPLWTTWGLLGLAYAADPIVFALSCDGTVDVTGWSKPQPTERMGVVVNLEDKTVSFKGWAARINYVDAAHIQFGGKQLGQQIEGVDITITGYIDRVTGHMTASAMMTDPSLPTSSPTDTTFDMYCKPTNRVF